MSFYKVTPQQYKRWLEDEVTQKVFETIKYSLESVQERIKNGGHIFQENGTVFLARDVGVRDAYEDIINLTVDDLLNNIEDNGDIISDESQIKTSGA